MVKKLRSAITRKSLGKPLSNKNKIKVFVADEPSNILIDGTEEYIDNGNDQDNTVDQGFDNADEEIKESVDEDYEANIVYESDLNNDDVDDEMDHEDESDTEPDSSDDEIEDIHDRMINAIQNFANVKEQKQEDVVKQRSDIVSMNALLNALGDGHGLGAVKQSLTELEKSMNAPTYVDKVISDRMERSIQYESTKKEMGKWHHVVVQNRNARTLDLANDERHKSSYRNLVKTFEPKSKFEKDIQMVLIKCNATDETAEKAEVDQLKGKDMDMDEIRQKQAELAKVRALLFYEQMKRHRINKIKSKAYHRIRKRQRQRKEQGNEETNTDSDHDEEEKELNEKKLLKRIEERMSLRHKNTSKWSKMALEHGKGDKSLRSAYHESVLMGQELMKRIHGDEDGNSDDGEYISNADNNESELSTNKLKAIIANEDEEEPNYSDGRYGKLMSMDFMRKAREKQKAQAREDAKVVLRELMDIEADDDKSQDDNEADSDLKTGIIDENRKAKAKADVEEYLNMSKELGTGMLFSKLNRSVVFDFNGDTSSTALLNSSDAQQVKEDLKDSNNTMLGDATFDSNPWLEKPSSLSYARDVAAVSTTTKTSATKHLNQARSVSNKGLSGKEDSKVYVTIHQIDDSLSRNDSAPIDDKKLKKRKLKEDRHQIEADLKSLSAKTDTIDTSKKDELKPLVPHKSQIELVQEAFAGPDLESEFQATKRQAVDKELEIDEKKKNIIQDVKAGWGDWAGPGSMGISKRTLNRRDALMKAVNEEADKKRAGRLDSSKKMLNVMISEKLVKGHSKYKLADIPHPFTTREEYEQSIKMPVGGDWNASTVVANNIQPDIKIKTGRILEPIKLEKANNPNKSSTKHSNPRTRKISKGK